MIKAILWDMDGVLVDTAELHFWSWTQTMKELGFPLTHQQFMATFGMNNQGALRQLLGLLPGPQLDAISDRKEYFFRQNIPGRVTVFPGVLDWLEYTRAQGIRCAVASSSPLENIRAILEHCKLAQYFETVVPGADLPSKPDPAVFIVAARQLDALPADCLVVEDSPHGAVAALRSAMHCLVVLTSHSSSDFLPVDLILNRLSDLTAFDALNKIDRVA